MKVIGVDTETARFGPAIKAPPLACVTTATPDGKTSISTDTSALERALDSDAVLAFHNAGYDVPVLLAAKPILARALFRALDEGRVRDTLLREQLIDIARGDFKENRGETGYYTLAGCGLRRLGVELDKYGGERETFGQLRGVPLDKWPRKHIEYALGDPKTTVDLFLEQETRAVTPDTPDWNALVPDAYETRASVALALAGCWGVMTNPDKVKNLRALAEAEVATNRKRLVELGVVRPDGTKNTKRVQELGEAAGLTERTATGKLVTDRDALLYSGDPVLKFVGESSAAEKILSTYVPLLERGVHYPIYCSFNPLVDSDRTSARDPNLQNLPKASSKNKLQAAVRAALCPRREHTFVWADYGTLEIVTLAQTIFDNLGESTMRDALIAGRDLHLMLAGVLEGADYVSLAERWQKHESGERVDGDLKKTRDFAKIGNFGCNGGMGWKALRDYARRSYGKILSDEEAKAIVAGHRETWHDLPTYLGIIEGLDGIDEGRATMRIPRTGFVRGGLYYTSAANTGFQTPAAGGGKWALWEVTRRAYSEPRSALFGSRVISYVHDEIVLEARKERAKDVGAEVKEIMIEQMRRVCPDVPVKVGVGMGDEWIK